MISCSHWGMFQIPPWVDSMAEAFPYGFWNYGGYDAPSQHRVMGGYPPDQIYYYDAKYLHG